ncbi:hypothetical protein PilKf_02491 [Pillotina sp. SPG140]|jgi:hypothetical protein
MEVKKVQVRTITVSFLIFRARNFLLDTFSYEPRYTSVYTQTQSMGTVLSDTVESVCSGVCPLRSVPV